MARSKKNKKMDASSRVIAVLVSTLDGSVVYERFWTRLSELERADLRAAAAATAAGLFAAGSGMGSPPMAERPSGGTGEACRLALFGF